MGPVPGRMPVIVFAPFILRAGKKQKTSGNFCQKVSLIKSATFDGNTGLLGHAVDIAQVSMNPATPLTWFEYYREEADRCQEPLQSHYRECD